MSEHRDSGDHWQTRSGFVLAAVGSAVGLGNVWRFPFVAYENGGGAFLLPYFIALFTTGIPLLILEFSLGHKTQRAAPEAFASIRRGFGFVGWTQTAMMFVIVLYYAVVMAWCWVYLAGSFSLPWGADANAYFNTEILARTEGPLSFGGLQWPVVAGLFVTWVCVFFIIVKGVKVVGKIVMVTVPLPLLLMVLLLIRGVTLDGAAAGLEYFLSPDFEKLKDPTAWLAAYTQIFFSVGLGMGVMIAYASYLPKKSDINNNAFMTSLANCGTSFMAGMVVFSALGFLAQVSGKPVAEVAQSGPGLAFVTYPTIISNLPFGAELFAVVFFVMLLTLGIDSAFSIVEGVVAALSDRWRINKTLLVAVTCVAGFLGGLIFATGAGLYWLDIVDHFLTFIALPLVGLLECVAVAWLFGAERLRVHANESSDFRVGRWWTAMVGIVTPSILVVLFVTYFVQRVREPYAGYDTLALLVGGWAVVLFVFAFGIGTAFFTRRPAAAEED